ANNIAGKKHLLATAAVALAPTQVPLGRPGIVYHGPVQVPYSVVAAVDWSPTRTTSLEKALRAAAADLKADGVVLVDWRGTPLRPRPGEEVAVTYFDPAGDGKTVERTELFRVASPLVRLAGPFNDPNLTPRVPGVTDKLPREWEPPFPFERSWV